MNKFLSRTLKRAASFDVLAPVRSKKEHDWTSDGKRLDRKDMPYSSFISELGELGKEITIVGWGLPCAIKKGDLLVLPNNGVSTRYKISKIKVHCDSSRMFELSCVFAPRK